MTHAGHSHRNFVRDFKEDQSGCRNADAYPAAIRWLLRQSCGYTNPEITSYNQKICTVRKVSGHEDNDGSHILHLYEWSNLTKELVYVYYMRIDQIVVR